MKLYGRHWNIVEVNEGFECIGYKHELQEGSRHDIGLLRGVALVTFMWEDLKRERLETDDCTFMRFNEDQSECIVIAVYEEYLGMTWTTQQVTAQYDCRDMGDLNITLT